VERVAAERLEAGHARQLRLVQEPVREHDEARADRVAAIGRTIQRDASSSHRISVTEVWKHASRYRSYFFAIAWQCARISGPRLYFSIGM
jgi:hypothetical protein